MRFRSVVVAAVAVLFVGMGGAAFAQKARIDTYHKALSGKLTAMVAQGQSCKVNMNDSTDGEGTDAEIRLTMGIREFESFAPIAVLEAAAIPHKFPAVNIYVRHEATGRVGRINFRDAEPLAASYAAGEREKAIEEMKSSITWH
ncbi:MAG TPA: hypothetical protein VEK15_13065 [Vicinamibacteria bacterium]|nr:hypothetical protein [Vicinamibacteria bacterium]